MTTADITISRSGSTAHFANYDGAVVATIVKTSAYHVRLYTSPDDSTYSVWATRAAAENVAMRHALKFA